MRVLLWSATQSRKTRSSAPRLADWMLEVSHHLSGDQASARKYWETSLTSAPIQNSSLIRSGYDQRIRALLTLARSLWLGG
jgi:hypothetical protein